MSIYRNARKVSTSYRALSPKMCLGSIVLLVKSYDCLKSMRFSLKATILYALKLVEAEELFGNHKIRLSKGRDPCDCRAKLAFLGV